MLVQDRAAEVLRDSSVTPVLLSSLWAHPESEPLLVMVYSLLTIIASQGGSALPSPLGPGAGGTCVPEVARPPASTGSIPRARPFVS